MLILFKTFLDICLLRRAPQELPASAALLLVVLGAHAASGFLLALMSHPAGQALLAGLTDTLLLAGLTMSLLYLTRLMPRGTQTLTALAGSGTVLGVFALLPTYWLRAAQIGQSDVTVPFLMLLVLIGWSITVMAHVLRHALGNSLAVGFLISVMFYWVSITVLNALFPLSG